MNGLYSRASRIEGRASKFCWATCPRASASKMYLSAPEGVGICVEKFIEALVTLNWEGITVIAFFTECGQV